MAIYSAVTARGHIQVDVYTGQLEVYESARLARSNCTSGCEVTEVEVKKAAPQPDTEPKEDWKSRSFFFEREVDVKTEQLDRALSRIAQLETQPDTVAVGRKTLRQSVFVISAYASEIWLNHTLENGQWPDQAYGEKAEHARLVALSDRLQDLLNKETP